MRKWIGAWIEILCLLYMFCLPALAANRVTDLTVDVVLYPDGSAHITQDFWAVTDEGTEFYLDYLNNGYLTITDFQVFDETGPYVVLEEGNWDADASFEEKAGKCGMLPIDGGVELCWGISEYGEHCYTVQYVLHDLAGAYDDEDGFNYRFVNADMGFFPTNVVLTIRNQDGTALTDENADIWAFGFDGQIQFEDGVIWAWTDTPLEGNANMTIMAALEKGVLFPKRQEKGSFEAVKERAFEGSDYEDDDNGSGMVLCFVFLAAVFAIFYFVVSAVDKAKRKKRERNTDYFREAPNGDDLNLNYILGSRLNYFPAETLLGARILKLLVMGSLEPTAMDLDTKNVSLRLVREPRGGDAYDEAFYTILQAAAGADGVLEPKELEQFCNSGPGGQSLAKFMDSCERAGVTALIQTGCLKGAKCEAASDLTKKGEARLGELLGLKRYLLDFSLIAERGVRETIIWQDYMVYAALLGIAKQVLEQMRRLYPAHIPQIEQYACYLDWSSRYDLLFYSAVQRERQRQQAARYSGSGGSVSWGGGGGFSGGGDGGIR